MALDLNVTLAAYLGKRNSTPLEIPVAHRWATGRWREPRRSVSRTHTRWQ
jgi:hypothetical protein